MILKHYFWLFIYFKMSISQNISTTNVSSDEPLWVPRVINGWPAKLGDVPYQVAMKYLLSRSSKDYKTFCGATIVGPTKLITAAHCFPEPSPSCEKLLNPGHTSNEEPQKDSRSKVRVKRAWPFNKQYRKASKRALKNKYAVAGNLRNREFYQADGPNGQWRTLHSVHYPKNYRFPKHDIAVAYLKKPFIFTQFIGPIPMASRNTDYNGKCLVSGFGRTGHAQHEQAEVLLLAHLDLMSKSVCTKVHRKRMDDFVCTSSALTDVGKGDSGGPLVCANTGDPNEKDSKGVLVGVVSGHSRRRGSFFTRVSRYKRFIAASKSTSVFMFKYYFGTYTIAMSLLYQKVLLF